MTPPTSTSAEDAFAPFDPELYRFTGQDPVITTILGSRSDATGDLMWPRRLRCPISGGTVSDVELAATGTVYSWTFVMLPWPGVESPSGAMGYGAGLIDLDGAGPRVIGVLLGGATDWSVGDRARGCPLPFMSADDGMRSLLAFEKVAS